MSQANLEPAGEGIVGRSPGSGPGAADAAEWWECHVQIGKDGLEGKAALPML